MIKSPDHCSRCHRLLVPDGNHCVRCGRVVDSCQIRSGHDPEIDRICPKCEGSKCDNCVVGKHSWCESGVGDGRPCKCKENGHFSTFGTLGEVGRIGAGDKCDYDRVFNYESGRYMYVMNPFKHTHNHSL